LLFAQCKMHYWWLVNWLDLTNAQQPSKGNDILLSLFRITRAETSQVQSSYWTPIFLGQRATVQSKQESIIGIVWSNFRRFAKLAALTECRFLSLPLSPLASTPVRFSWWSETTEWALCAHGGAEFPWSWRSRVYVFTTVQSFLGARGNGMQVKSSAPQTPERASYPHKWKKQIRIYQQVELTRK
jgi:hypothetical protein